MSSSSSSSSSSSMSTKDGVSEAKVLGASGDSLDAKSLAIVQDITTSTAKLNPAMAVGVRADAVAMATNMQVNAGKKKLGLPETRIRSIMKCDGGANILAVESSVVMAKACELFIEDLARESFVYTKADKRNTLYMEDMAHAVQAVPQFDFLEGVLPIPENMRPIKLKGSMEKRTEQSKKRKFEQITDDKTVTPEPASLQRSFSKEGSIVSRANSPPVPYDPTLATPVIGKPAATSSVLTDAASSSSSVATPK